MRLNDPQIELVHDDPFMGYIETVRAGTPSPRPTALLDIAEEAATEPASAPAAPIDDDEDVDVGENSRAAPEQLQSPPPPPSASRSSVSVRTNRDEEAGTDQSIVIVLLVE